MSLYLILDVFVLVVAVVTALVVGYAIGKRRGSAQHAGGIRRARASHDAYKDDVREHFERTSAIMSRMVDDYRQMYEHMSTGAHRLADIHPQKRATPPPPDAITREEPGPERAARSAPDDTPAAPVPAVDAAENDDPPAVEPSAEPAARHPRSSQRPAAQRSPRRHKDSNPHSYAIIHAEARHGQQRSTREADRPQES